MVSQLFISRTEYHIAEPHKSLRIWAIRLPNPRRFPSSVAAHGSLPLLHVCVGTKCYTIIKTTVYYEVDSIGDASLIPTLLLPTKVAEWAALIPPCHPSYCAVHGTTTPPSGNSLQGRLGGAPVTQTWSVICELQYAVSWLPPLARWASRALPPPRYHTFTPGKVMNHSPGVLVQSILPSIQSVLRNSLLNQKHKDLILSQEEDCTTLILQAAKVGPAVLVFDVK